MYVQNGIDKTNHHKEDKDVLHFTNTQIDGYTSTKMISTRFSIVTYIQIAIKSQNSKQ